jgi:hypothetical protein
MSPAARTCVHSTGLGASGQVQSACRHARRFPGEFTKISRTRQCRVSALPARLHPWARLPSRRCDNSTAPPTELPDPMTFPPQSPEDASG